VTHLVAQVGASSSGLGQWLAERRQPKTSGKRWVRPDETDTSASANIQPQPADTVVVSSFAEIDALIEAEPAEPEAASSQAG
jgi:hypothetical protein